MCPLCGTRRARRGCPALDKQICAVCCGTKRLVQIRCPTDCAWLATAREHPPATFVRQRQRDVGVLSRILRDLNERQSQLLFLVATFLTRYQPAELHAPIDDDVAEAIGSLAAKLLPVESGVPPYVSFSELRNGAAGAAGYLGTAYNPFIVNSDPNEKNYAVRDLTLIET